MSTNGHKQTINALMEDAQRVADSDKASELERVILLLLVALVNRQNDIYSAVDDVKKTPIVVASDFVNNNRKLAVFMFMCTLAFLALLSQVSFADIIKLLDIVP